MAKQQQLVTSLAVPETRKYSYWQAFYLSFFSADLYRDVAKRWHGFGISYLFLLIVILTIPITIINLIVMQRYYNAYVVPSIQKIPELQVTNGQISIKTVPPVIAKDTYIITDDVDHKPFIVIDTSGKTSSLEQSKSKILITNNKIIAQLIGSGKPLEQNLTGSLNGTISSHDLLIILDNSKRIFFYTLYPSSVLLFFTAQFFTLYLFSFIGTYLSTMVLKFKIKFTTSLRLTCIAATPEVLLASIFLIMKKMSPSTGLLFFVVLVLYYLYAVRAYKVSSTQLAVM